MTGGLTQLPKFVLHDSSDNDRSSQYVLCFYFLTLVGKRNKRKTLEASEWLLSYYLLLMVALFLKHCCLLVEQNS